MKSKKHEKIEIIKKKGIYKCKNCNSRYFSLYLNVYSKLVEKEIPHLEIVCAKCQLSFVIPIKTKGEKKK